MSSERSIPHLRDIFGLSNNYNQTTYNNGNVNGQNSSGRQVGPATPTYPADIYSNNIQQDALLNNRKQSRKKRSDNNKTLTSGDVKTLERHLSMKKTIRKKIMRDLQQAFVDDPNEFKIENTNSEHLKAELNAEAIRFGENPNKKSDNFLYMLRGNNDPAKNSCYDYQTQQTTTNDAQRREYDYDAPSLQQRDEKQSFWKRFTMKNKAKR